MRGGRGLGSIANMKKQQQNAGLLSLQIQKEQEQKLSQQLEAFTKNLEEFAKKYKDEIKYNPDFREKFYLILNNSWEPIYHIIILCILCNEILFISPCYLM